MQKKKINQLSLESPWENAHVGNLRDAVVLPVANGSFRWAELGWRGRRGHPNISSGSCSCKIQSPFYRVQPISLIWMPFLDILQMKEPLLNKGHSSNNLFKLYKNTK